MMRVLCAAALILLATPQTSELRPVILACGLAAARDLENMPVVLTPLPLNCALSDCSEQVEPECRSPSDACVFPFVYHGTTYETCTRADSNILW